MTMFPVVAPAGTGITISVALQELGVAAVPLNLTVLEPCVSKKFEPSMVIGVPIDPELWERLPMDGAGSSVKLTPLLATPPTVTTAFPVVVPGGTGAVMLVELHAVGVAVVPLNLIVLDP